MTSPDSYDWYCMIDPGTSGSAFAGIFCAVDIYKPYVFFLDEIYEKDVEKTVTPYTGPLIIKKCYELYDRPERWKCYYDSAGAWFAAHFKKSYANPDPEPGSDAFDCGLRFAPVVKAPGEKEDGLDTLNAMFINNSIAMSQKCGNTIWEYDNYCRDKHGKLPKRNDHNIDNGRYLVKMAGIVAGLSVNRPLSARRRKAKNTRDYNSGPDPRSKGTLNLKARIIKPYEYN